MAAAAGPGDPGRNPGISDGRMEGTPGGELDGTCGAAAGGAAVAGGINGIDGLDRTALHEALQLWKGPALADYADEPWAAAEIARLTELRTVARERLLAAREAVQCLAQTVGALHGEQDVFEFAYEVKLFRQREFFGSLGGNGTLGWAPLRRRPRSGQARGGLAT